MAVTQARTFEFEVDLDTSWTAHSDRGDEPLAPDKDTWMPEHLVLAGVCRCSLTSLNYHARRSGIHVESQAHARGSVTRRPDDGRFAFTAIEVSATVSLDPPQDEEAVRSLLSKAERDCFVGASMTAEPRYRWTVDGKEIA